MEKEMNRSVRELQCALQELNELRMFKDVVLNSSGSESLVVKRVKPPSRRLLGLLRRMHLDALDRVCPCEQGGGYASLLEVVKQAQVRLAKGTRIQLLETPGWDHAQKLAEFYGVDSDSAKFISKKSHGIKHTPRAPSAAKKPAGATPRTRKAAAATPPRVASLPRGGRAARAQSAPPARPRPTSTGR